MSEKWYVYEYEAMDSYHAAHPVTEPRGWCEPETLQREVAAACAAATWAGFQPEEVRYCALPGDGHLRAYYTSFSEGHGIVVSPVPLGWLPERSRRGVFQRVSK